jgi:hypothetical protein
MIGVKCGVLERAIIRINIDLCEEQRRVKKRNCEGGEQVVFATDR